MKVLVTGGSGLVGESIRETVNSLTNENEYIFLSSKDCDLTNQQKVDDLFNFYKPSVVIHLAAKVGGLYANIDSNYIMLMDNLKISTNILEACKKYNIKRLVNILSTCVFGNDLSYPLTSDQMYDKIPDSSNEGYSYSKRLLDTGSKLLTNCSNMEIVNLIPTNIYGLNDNYNLKDGHVLPALIHKTFIAKTNNDKLIIKGKGSSRRQFIFAEDLSKIILHFVDCNLSKQFNRLIVGPPEIDEITIKELINKITKEFDFNGEIIYDTSFSEGQFKKTVNDKELLDYISNFKFTSIENGLKKTINYFTENYLDVRK